MQGYKWIQYTCIPKKKQTRRDWVSCCHLNGAWCTCLTLACGSDMSTPLGHWHCAVWKAASWKTITTLDHSAAVLGVGEVLATRLGHVSLLLLGLSSGQKHLVGGLGCGFFCLWLGKWRWTPLWRYSSSTRNSSHSAHPYHAGPLQLWHGVSLQWVPDS